MSGRIVLTPAGRFLSIARAARYHDVHPATVQLRIREGWPGWQYAEPYQIPAVVLASRPRRPRERGTSAVVTGFRPRSAAALTPRLSIMVPAHRVRPVRQGGDGE
jgi:hypothetical protein